MTIETDAPSACPPISRDRLGLATPYAPPRTSSEAILGALWSAALNLDRVGIDDDFFKLGGDSVVAGAIVVEIEARLGRRVPLSIFVRSPTLSSLAAWLDRSRDQDDRARIYTVLPGGTVPPLFMVHGALGLINVSPAMAEALGPQQQVLGIAPRGLLGEAAPHAAIEDMAAEYLSLIRSHQPQGAILLGGICFGAIVAYEIARQHLATGGRIHTVLMVDPPIGSAEGRTVAPPDHGYFIAVDNGVAQIRSRITPFLSAATGGETLPSEAVDERIRRAMRVQDAIHPAVGRYRPKPLASAVEFICSSGIADALRADRCGWRRSAGAGTRLWVAANTHADLFAGRSGRVGRIMRRTIDEALARKVQA